MSTQNHTPEGDAFDHTKIISRADLKATIAERQALIEVAAAGALALSVAHEIHAYKNAEARAIRRGVSPNIFLGENGLPIEPWMAYIDDTVQVTHIHIDELDRFEEPATNDAPVLALMGHLNGRPVADLQASL